MIENNSIWAERVKEIIKHLDIANLAYCPLHMFEQRILYEITGYPVSSKLLKYWIFIQ